MHEITVNLHMHTQYSDGSGTHAELAHAALQNGVDVIIVTDHNIWPGGQENYYQDGDRRTLLLIGEEVHDRQRVPQGNHLLIIGAGREMASYARDPQLLIDQANQSAGMTFLAHPFETRAPAIGEPALSWENWDVTGFTGIEIWNGMSELKSRLSTKLHGLAFVITPKRIARGPANKAVEKWDLLLNAGEQVVAIGGTDAHALIIKLGPIQKKIFPYGFHFRTINNHLLLPEPLKGELEYDRQLVLSALRAGRSFIGYDLPARTNGFRFYAQGMNDHAWMGEQISSVEGVTLQIRLPLRAACRLIKDGQTIKSWAGRETYTHITTEPGVYRVVVYIHYLGRDRTWIVSNPIYVRP
jgi:PHP domain